MNIQYTEKKYKLKKRPFKAGDEGKLWAPGGNYLYIIYIKLH